MGVQLNAHSGGTTQPSGRRGVQLNALQTSHQGYRRSVRLQGYDYGQAGAYFVTICTQNRLPYFENTAVHAVASDCWLEIPSHFPSVDLDAWVLMPNHLHGVLIISHAVGAQHAAPLRPNVVPGSLGAITPSFKSPATRRINQTREADKVIVWQRNYHEHVIRSDDDLERARHYVFYNPQQWDSDELNPQTRPASVGAFN